MTRGAPQGRAGRIGTSMNVERQRRYSPRLRLPKRPNKNDYYSASAINTMARQLRFEGKIEAAEEFEGMTSWERAIDTWNKEVAVLRKAHADRLVVTEENRKAKAAENLHRIKEEVDYLKAHDLPLPSRYRKM